MRASRVAGAVGLPNFLTGLYLLAGLHHDMAEVCVDCLILFAIPYMPDAYLYPVGVIFAGTGFKDFSIGACPYARSIQRQQIETLVPRKTKTVVPLWMFVKSLSADAAVYRPLQKEAVYWRKRN